MDIDDLRAFAAVARSGSIRGAADSLHQTPSALSKAVRRLEGALKVRLFDRIGKTVRLNAMGERLRGRATALLQLADDTRAEFLGARSAIRCRIGGPALLQWRHAGEIAERLTTRYPDSTVAVLPLFENAAVAALERGEVDVALVTHEALRQEADRIERGGLAALPLGRLEFHLFAGASHPLAQSGLARVRRGPRRATAAAVLGHDFVSPTHSLLCGEPRGASADGWNQRKLPRRIRYWIDDLQVLLGLVRSGKALAYLPDFAEREPGLVRIEVGDCPFRCIERVSLLWRPSGAFGWQHWLIDELR